MELKKGDIRPATVRSYTSFIKNFSVWLTTQKKEDIYCLNFTRDLLIKFLDHIYYKRDNSARTYNNYLSFFHTLGSWMLLKTLVKANPADGIPSLKTKAKKRVDIPAPLLKEIFQYLDREIPSYSLLCQLTYNCMIRRTELTRAKVGDIYLKDQVTLLPEEASKNGEKEPVTIPDILIPTLASHLANSSNHDFLFSEDFLPGSTPLVPKKISDTWAKVRRTLGFSEKYQWYSLKDTGITEMLEMGEASIKVRDQARHKYLSTTEIYARRNRGAADPELKNLRLSLYR